VTYSLKKGVTIHSTKICPLLKKSPQSLMEGATIDFPAEMVSLFSDLIVITQASISQPRSQYRILIRWPL
jgi:hypothetical protein